MTEGMENRRREERYAVNTVITVANQQAMVKDLSLGGMRISAVNLKPLQLVDLTLRTGQSEIAMKALVRWVKRTFPFESYSECGLAFVSAPGAYHDLYRDITQTPRFLPVFGLWPVSLLLLIVAFILILWI